MSLSISDSEAHQLFETFVDKLDEAFANKDIGAIEALFLPQGYLRDLLITEWDFNSIPNAKGELKSFFESKGVPALTKFAVDGKKARPTYVDAVQWIQGYFTFESPIALGEGHVRLQKGTTDGAWKAFTLSLTLESLKQYPEIAGASRPQGVIHGPHRGHQNWLDLRNQTSASPNPQVLIVGAGHSGLMLAARLKRLGIHALLIDKVKRLGDSWRQRYHSLVLHDVVWGNHFPYLNFPDDWPIFISKDKIANWFESYASIMELNVWTESTVEPNTTVYDEATGHWNLRVRRGDGTLIDVTCHQIVQATGHSGEPSIPTFAGIDDFKGTIVHSSAHKGAHEWKGKKAVVLGSGNSGHDIAHEFYGEGADVTMVQRSETIIITSKMGLPILLGPAYVEGGPPVQEADLATISFPIRPFQPLLAHLHNLICELEKSLHDGLRAAGFKVAGEGSPGLLVKYWRDGGGYYIDVGASQLIVDGRIKLKQGQEVDRFEEKGIRFKDGSFLEADIIVLATGYKSMRETCRKLFGSKVADRTGPVWGFDKQGEIRGIWRSSGHPGFWYMGGNFLLARAYSHFLALQIKAAEEGLVPKKGASTASARS